MSHLDAINFASLNDQMTLLNDVQSQLNQTIVSRVQRPSSPKEVGILLNKARSAGESVCPAGALHSMGGQQFLTKGVSLSSDGLDSIGPLDEESKRVTVQSGVRWPELVRWLRNEQCENPRHLTIIQKQTGADALSLGGALSSNIHSRVLGRKPIVEDIESFYITTSDGSRVKCSREENSELFQCAIGGYGLFGFVDSINLKLTERQQLKREVTENSLEEVIPLLENYADRGATYGDFQYMTDEDSQDFLSKGILSVYIPTFAETDSVSRCNELTIDDWKRLFVLAHTNKKIAYHEYLTHYMKTDGQLYWSDDHQFSPYLPEAGALLSRELGWTTPRSLMITELYVPRSKFVDFMKNAKKILKETKANLVYGTVRLIERENETFLRWASQDFACVIFNLLVEHSSEGKNKASYQFQMLIDCALNEGGSFYLTYHRWARKDQVEAAYPQFREFLERKDHWDPVHLFRSDWYSHYATLFA